MEQGSAHDTEDRDRPVQPDLPSAGSSEWDEAWLPGWVTEDATDDVPPPTGAEPAAAAVAAELPEPEPAEPEEPEPAEPGEPEPAEPEESPSPAGSFVEAVLGLAAGPAAWDVVDDDPDGPAEPDEPTDVAVAAAVVRPLVGPRIRRRRMRVPAVVGLLAAGAVGAASLLVTSSDEPVPVAESQAAETGQPTPAPTRVGANAPVTSAAVPSTPPAVEPVVPAVESTVTAARRSTPRSATSIGDHAPVAPAPVPVGGPVAPTVAVPPVRQPPDPGVAVPTSEPVPTSAGSPGPTADDGTLVRPTATPTASTPTEVPEPTPTTTPAPTGEPTATADPGETGTAPVTGAPAPTLAAARR